MIGNDIVVTSPFGQKIEGIITDTSKPGTVMQIVGGTAPVGGLNGRLSYKAFAPGVGDGAPRQLLILDVDHLQGGTYDTAYVNGTRCFLWAPLPGDVVNVRKADISGTGSATEDLAIGDRCLIVDGTGKISKVAVGLAASPIVYPFVSMETLVDQPAEMLVGCQVSGY